MESIIDYLRRRLKEVGPRRWEAIAEQAGVARRMPERIAYGERKNPTLRTVQRLLDYFDAIDRGARELPAPDIDPRYLPRSARPREGRPL
jgi:transcriptional regulator with XRE-family HTH domain